MQLLDPEFDTLKRCPVGDVIDDEGTGRLPVVCHHNRPVFLLARSVPELRLYCGPVSHDNVGRCELYAYSWRGVL